MSAFWFDVRLKTTKRKAAGAIQWREKPKEYVRRCERRGRQEESRGEDKDENK